MRQAQPDLKMTKEANMTTKTSAIEGTVAEYVTAMIGGQLFGLPISRVLNVFHAAARCCSAVCSFSAAIRPGRSNLAT